MVFAEHAHGAGLEPLLAVLLDERDGRSHFQLAKRVVQYARTIEVDAALICLDEAVIIVS